MNRDGIWSVLLFSLILSSIFGIWWWVGVTVAAMALLFVWDIVDYVDY